MTPSYGAENVFNVAVNIAQLYAETPAVLKAP